MTVRLYQVECADKLAALPAACAACGAVAARSRVEHVGASVLVIPYCDACLRLTGVSATRQLAVLLASALSGVSFAAFAPLVWPWMSVAEGLILALGVALVPYLALLVVSFKAVELLRFRRAAWGGEDGRLVGINLDWMKQVASLSQGVLVERKAAFRDRWAYPRLFWITLIAPLALGPPAFLLTHPKVWVLNLNRMPLDVFVDGQRVAEALAPTSGESPAAGQHIRIAAGRRTWQAVDSRGQVVDQRISRVSIGAEHLYAPGQHDYCFRLETTEYGLAGRGAEREQVRERWLAPGSSFWTFEDDIDTWFAPNPPSPRAGLPASGGKLTAVRQAHCERHRAADEARKAVEAAPSP